MDNNEKQKIVWWQPALLMFGRLSAWIVAPVLIGTFLGRFLDRKFESEPVFLIGTVIFAFIISMFGLVRETIKEYGRIEEESKK